MLYLGLGLVVAGWLVQFIDPFDLARKNPPLIILAYIIGFVLIVLGSNVDLKIIGPIAAMGALLVFVLISALNLYFQFMRKKRFKKR